MFNIFCLILFVYATTYCVYYFVVNRKLIKCLFGFHHYVYLCKSFGITRKNPGYRGVKNLHFKVYKCKHCDMIKKSNHL